MEKNNQAKDEVLNRLLREITRACDNKDCDLLVALSSAYQRIASVTA